MRCPAFFLVSKYRSSLACFSQHNNSSKKKRDFSQQLPKAPAHPSLLVGFFSIFNPCERIFLLYHLEADDPAASGGKPVHRACFSSHSGGHYATIMFKQMGFIFSLSFKCSTLLRGGTMQLLHFLLNIYWIVCGKNIIAKQWRKIKWKAFRYL